ACSAEAALNLSATGTVLIVVVIVLLSCGRSLTVSGPAPASPLVRVDVIRRRGCGVLTTRRRGRDGHAPPAATRPAGRHPRRARLRRSAGHAAGDGHGRFGAASGAGSSLHGTS